MAKFKIGDKVRILDVDSIICGRKYWRNGDITEVVGFFGGNPRLRRTVGLQYGANGDSLSVAPEEFHAIELVSENFTVRPTILKEVFSKPSANERRKQAIEKAKRFVADTQRTVKNDHPTDRGNDVYKRYRTVSEFVVNEEKRTVVALIRYNGFPEDGPIAKGIAKCAPTDVFNEHIGKAIALGRAYGLDVSEFEQAPQPDEVVVGMNVETLLMWSGEPTGKISKVVEVREDGYPQFSIGYASHYRITSDTEAQY